MNQKPLVTIYIPCRNYGRFLSQSAESVFQQLYTNWELIIVDEGSDDDTIVIAEELCRRYPDKAKLVKNSKSIGLQRIANKVLGLANGKYMIRLDADDWLDEVALLVLVEKLEKTPDAGLVYGNYYYTTEDGKVLGIESQTSQESNNLRRKVIPPHGACTLFSVRALKSTGGYSIDINAQDGWELWHKLIDRVGAVSISTPVFYYRQHGQSLSNDKTRLLKARAQIFRRLSDKLTGDYQLKILAVIPVKEHYAEFHSVPFKEIAGRSLLQIAIDAAQKSSNITEVLVSSASARVLDFSKTLESNGLVAKHDRLLRADDGLSGLQVRELMLEAGEGYKDKNGGYPDIITFLSLHAVNRTGEHIDSALDILKVSEADSVVSVQEEREPVFLHNSPESLDLLNPGRFEGLQFERERLFRFNGSVVAAWWDVLKDHDLFGERISFLEMSGKDSWQVKNDQELEMVKRSLGENVE